MPCAAALGLTRGAAAAIGVPGNRVAARLGGCNRSVTGRAVPLPWPAG
jgi:hypothetical protein